MKTQPVRPGRRVQLHRACSKLGWGSRTQATTWIRSGQIRVDGRVVTDPLTWVDLDRQRIEWIGDLASGVASAPREIHSGRSRYPARQIQRARNDKSRLVIALHKPKGVVTTRRDERGRRTVYDLLPPGLPWVFPAGRLDADSEGLLILTNDSALAVRLTEPDEHVPKTYQVTIRGVPSVEALDQLRRGIRLTDGLTRPTKVRVVRSEKQSTVVEITLTEGRNRQIRRMWHAAGLRVKRLVRVGIGGYDLGDLRPSQCRRLSAKDVRRLVGRETVRSNHR
jgi:23S rRNA pseudouridine2605 synthase